MKAVWYLIIILKLLLYLLFFVVCLFVRTLAASYDIVAKRLEVAFPSV